MSEVVERVALAIARCHGSDSADSIAREAIRAMREPTQKMLSAGGYYHIQGAGSVSDFDMNISKREWQAMIDEALK